MNHFLQNHRPLLPVLRRAASLPGSLLAIAALQCCALDAHAKPLVMRHASIRASSRSAAAAAPAPVPARAETHTYRAALAVAYLLTPALAAAGGVGVFEATEGITGLTLGVVAGSVLLSPPAAVHAYNGASAQRALASYGTLVGFTLGGAAALGGVAYLLAAASCDASAPENEAEGCGWVIFGPTLIAASAGAIIGYVSYAVYDVVNGASIPAAAGAGMGRDDRELSLWLTPLSSPRDEGHAQRRVSGFQAGLSLQF